MTITDHTSLTLNYIKKKTNKIIVFYSGGKDSIVLLDLCAKHFDEVHAVFMYFVKDLDHQKPLLNFATNYKNVTLHQYPHWMLSHFYKRGNFRFHSTQTDSIKVIKQKHIEDYARLQTGCNWLVTGEKRADNVKRYMFLGMQKFDSICDNMKHAYPLSHWKKQDVLAYINQKRLIKPVSYNPKANSEGVSVDIDVLLFLREKFPSDYKKIINIFPFSEKQIFEYDYAKLIETSEI